MMGTKRAQKDEGEVVENKQVGESNLGAATVLIVVHVERLKKWDIWNRRS
jgi:hypothetical protein